LGRRRGLEQVGFWRKLLEHPAYDAFWRDQAVDKILAAQPLNVPVMLVHSLWDQEDIYGDIAVYNAIEPKDAANDKVFLVMGPWHHGQEIADGSTLGALKFGADTALQFRREILAPFLAQYLKDGAPRADVAPVTAFETGTNTWRRFPRGRQDARPAARSRASRCISAHGSASASTRRRRQNRRSTNTSRIPRSRFRFDRGRFNRLAARTGHGGWSTISGKRRAGPMC
jgi:predicted acyl esterase